ncbi:chalcone isomerase [Tanacetum coccineum]
MEGNNVKVTATGLYLEEKAIESLAIKWKCKTDVELMDSDEFYNGITNGCFEKLVRVSMLVPLTGKNFSETTSQKMVMFWKKDGTYNDEDAATIDKYLEVFEHENLKPGGDSVLFTHLLDGSATLSIAKSGIIPEAPVAACKSKKWGEMPFEGIIGKNGVVPETRQSIASRLSDLFN